MTEHHIGVSEDGEFVEVHDPGSQGYVIDKLYVIVAVDENGGEGIMAERTDMGWMPLISSDEQGIEMLVRTAQKMIDVAPNGKAHVIELSSRRVVRTLE